MFDICVVEFTTVLRPLPPSETTFVKHIAISLPSVQLKAKTADERHTAMFQLKSRLRKAGISHVPLAGEEHTPSFTPVDDTGDFAEDLDLSNEDSVPDALEQMTTTAIPSS
ncbi:hypothetical protein C8R43DRAFT_947059 [Mycena crocata]|nr:hypothetical protein C8R43DRAFT_947059 [Mycena crocata]